MTRAFLRSVLSRYADVERRAWRFGLNPHGRPYIEGPKVTAPIEFNISNTEGVVVCLVAAIPEIGVDVEFISRQVKIVDIADRFFSKSEATALRALPVSERYDQFYAYWTLKEAYVKARGMGFAIPLEAISFDLHEPDIAINFGSAIADDPDAWQFARLALSPRHVCATALRFGATPPVAIQVYEEIPPPSGAPW